MAQTVAPASNAFGWTLRVYDAIPVAAGWTGAMLAVVLYALFLVVEAALGRTPIRLESDLLAHSRDALITLLLCALLAYLCTATVSAAREAPRATGRVRHLLAEVSAATHSSPAARPASSHDNEGLYEGPKTANEDRRTPPSAHRPGGRD